MRNRRLVFSALSIGCAVLAAGPSWAATIEPGYGDLTINQGQGFNPVTSRTNANVGDSVMVGPGGTATVVYDDGCKVRVQPGAVATIAPLSPCASGSYAADLGLPPPAVAPQQAYVEDNSAWLGVGVGLLAAGALGVGIWRASEGNGTTSTPVITSTPITPASP
jgi:hypothetical protein